MCDSRVLNSQTRQRTGGTGVPQAGVSFERLGYDEIGTVALSRSCRELWCVIRSKVNEEAVTRPWALHIIEETWMYLLRVKVKDGWKIRSAEV